jgi:hypothetical protein
MNTTPGPITDKIHDTYLRPLAEVLNGLRPTDILDTRLSRTVELELRAQTFPIRGSILRIGGWTETTPTGRTEITAFVHLRTSHGPRTEALAMTLDDIKGRTRIVAIKTPHLRVP